MPTEPQVPVTQADRDAAADLIDAYFQHNEQMHQLAEDYRKGYSFGPFPLAFAQHASTARCVAVEEAAKVARTYPVEGLQGVQLRQDIATAIEALSPPRPEREDVEGREEALATLRKWLSQCPRYEGDDPRAVHYRRNVRVYEAAIKALSGSPS